MEDVEEQTQVCVMDINILKIQMTLVEQEVKDLNSREESMTGAHPAPQFIMNESLGAWSNLHV